MKKISTLFALLPFASVAFGQAITINSTDMPVPTAAYNLLDITTSTAPNPTVGTNVLWNYGGYSGTATTNTYVAETDTFFTNAGVDVYLLNSKTLTPGFYYNYYSEIDFNSSNVKEAGYDVLAQAYGLGTFTGTATDTLYFPAQRAIMSAQRTYVKFPFTANSAWSTVSRKAINFNLTAATYSNTPGQHVFYFHRNDTVVGWGKVRVYTASGPSMMYDVLMDKISQYAVDSFYLSGAPAPSTILGAFHVSQGQTTDTTYRYNFYKKGSYNYLMSFFYGTDPTFSNPSGKFILTDGIVTSNAGVNNLNDGNYSTVLFPNPSNGSEINLMFTDASLAPTTYMIADITGKTVLAGNVTIHNGIVNIPFNGKLVNGNYIVNIFNDKNKNIATEQFAVTQ